MGQHVEDRQPILTIFIKKCMCNSHLTNSVFTCLRIDIVRKMIWKENGDILGKSEYWQLSVWVLGCFVYLFILFASDCNIYSPNYSVPLLKVTMKWSLPLTQKMSQNSHESERDLFFPEKGCVPTTRECVLLEAAMQPSVGGGESCLSCNRSRAVLGGQGSEERWGDCRGMATCPQLHLPGPPWGNLPPAPPPWSSHFWVDPDSVPLWHVDFPRFKTIHRTHPRTCVLLAQIQWCKESFECAGVRGYEVSVLVGLP